MKHKLLLLLGCLALAGTVAAAPLGTTISYQGKLDDSGSPANGTYSFRFRLLGDATGTTQIGPVVDMPSLSLAGGLLNAPLDFGSGAFNADARWLEISVKAGGPGAAADYIKLNPQPLPPAGSSQFARVAGDVLNGTITGAKLAPLAITTTHISDGSITAPKLGPASITSGNVADNAITAAKIASGQVVKSLTVGASVLRDNVTLAAGANVTLTPSGNTVTISSAGPGGAGIWTALNGNAYYNGGPVGIGTANPGRLLQLGDVGIQGSQGLIRLASRSGTGGYSRTWDLGVPEGGDSDGDGRNYSFVIDDTSLGTTPELIVRYGSGNVGIGTANPLEKLAVLGRISSTIDSDEGGSINLRNPRKNGAAARAWVFYNMTGAYGDSLQIWSYPGSGSPGATRFAIRDDGTTILAPSGGSVHWGTSSLQQDQGGAIELGNSLGNGNTPFLDFHYGVGAAQDFNVRLINDADGLLTLGGNFLRVNGAGGEQAYIGGDGAGGDVEMGSLNPSVTTVALYNPRRNGGEYMHLNMKSCTIYGGADLAEPFPMEETIDKGSVVIIDEEHPGQLKMSTRAFDTRVAGIVSGANGINPGIALKQEGALDQGQNVALSGRVYVQADASLGAIKPGDLLTTSDTPGHAMKVTDSTRAQGAILGKAMTALAEGKGLVLVLVTLQ